MVSAITTYSKVLLGAKDWNWGYDFKHPPTQVSTLHLSLCLMPSTVPGALLDNKLHKETKCSRGKPETPSSPAKEPNLLNQCFINVNRHRTHLGILLTFRLRFRRSGVGREMLHFRQAPRWCASRWSRTTNGGAKYQSSYPSPELANLSTQCFSFSVGGHTFF